MVLEQLLFVELIFIELRLLTAGKFGILGVLNDHLAKLD